ncbi:hypothetical protein BgAZ_205210 [Babesia gibsoni]|uniref:SUI1 domain-containing protein n=1 Tax=Babesia gibsoni TaxID=33632 RepID=A0AAD8LJ08_BABGI|nr:hypothetical protein BgAZ_205210 [Babesia gibsoni]
MFKKVELGNSSLVGSKDRKVLRARAVKAFSLNDSQADSLMPPKAAFSVAKLAGTRHTLYMADADPCLVVLHDGLIIPTIYALWNAPPVFPELKIHRQVLSYIMRGAHLMIPGVLNWSDSFQAGSLAVVTLVGSTKPVAIGICQNPLDDNGELKTSGRALEVLHHYGDGLCKLSPKPFPCPDLGDEHAASEEGATDKTVHSQNDNNAAIQSDGCDSCSATIEGNSETQIVTGEGVAHSNVAEPQAVAESTIEDITESVENMGMHEHSLDSKNTVGESVRFAVPLVDLTLRICFLQTIHNVTDDKLPMDISALYSQMNADGTKIVSKSAFKSLVKEANMWDDNVCTENAGALISYKNSSFKKIAKMFQAWAKEGLISMKEARGVTTVVQIHRSSEAYVKFTPFNIAKEKEKDAKKVDKIVVRRLLAFSAGQRKDLAALGLHIDNKPMGVDQFKKIVIEHISNEGSVILDHMNKATQYHQIWRGDESAPICKGPAQPVTVSVEPRGNRKHITVVKGLFNYLFNEDEDSILETLRRKFASAVSVNNGVISIQGRVPVKNELVDHFGLSQQHIKLL